MLDLRVFAVGSFIVMHGAHGGSSWGPVAEGSLPEGIAFDSLPTPFYGVLLEKDFFAAQMQRAKQKAITAAFALESGEPFDTSFVTVDCDALLDGLVRRGVACVSPAKYPVVFLECTLEGDEYRDRFALPPFFYGHRVYFPGASGTHTAAFVDERPVVHKALRKAGVQAHRHYYLDILGGTVVPRAKGSPKAPEGSMDIDLGGHYEFVRGQDKPYYNTGAVDFRKSAEIHDVNTS